MRCRIFPSDTHAESLPNFAEAGDFLSTSFCRIPFRNQIADQVTRLIQRIIILEATLQFCTSSGDGRTLQQFTQFGYEAARRAAASQAGSGNTQVNQSPGIVELIRVNGCD